jgi:hypothetical protein
MPDRASECSVKVLGGRDADAALLHILQPQHNLVDLAQGVVADGVGNKLLFNAFEVEISSVSKELLAMSLVPDADGIATQQAQQLGKGIGVAIRHRGWKYRGWTYQPFAIEAGE